MLSMGLSAVARWRRPLLLAVVPLAVVVGGLVELRHGWVWFAIGMGPFLALLLLSVVSMIWFHPAVLVARPREPAFAVGPDPGWVLLTAAMVIQGSLVLGGAVHDIVVRAPLWGLGAVPAGLFVFLLTLQWRTAWGWYGVQLRPEGVYDRQPLGSLFVPWEAFVPAYPAALSGAQRVVLYFQRPDLVRSRGLRVGGPSLRTAGVDGAFLARAILEYASAPGHRQAIGTEPELRRLTAAIAR